MERTNKKFILITIFICILLLSGCDKIRFGTYNASEEEKKSDITLDQNDKEKSSNKKGDNEDDTVLSADDTGKVDTTSVTANNIQPTANTELMIYTVNMDTGEIAPVTALIPEGEEITPKLIVSTVVESMTDQSLTVGIDRVDTENETVIVSFKSDQPPLTNVGGGIEFAILDAIAQSLIDNLDDYNSVIYRVEGKAYSSEHITLKIDEVYLDDK
ncbi:MAG: hypothetical protein K0S76_2353 [Herbinix sp.]|jgi:hypothetical protein|nr:hypothetical protein [Herbinix sp.]